jgi:hypothetical protein
VARGFEAAAPIEHGAENIKRDQAWMVTHAWL